MEKKIILSFIELWGIFMDNSWESTVKIKKPQQRNMRYHHCCYEIIVSS